MWVAVLTAAIATFLGGRLVMLALVEGGPGKMDTVMWAPTGITFALAWRAGMPALVGSALGMFVFNLGLLQGHPLFALIAAIAHALPAAYARWQLRRNRIDDIFATPGGVLQFAVFAVLIAPLLSSSFGALGPLLDTSSPIEWQFSTWLALWAAEANGMLLIAPVLLSLRDWRRVERGRWLELLGVLLCALLLGWEVFVQHPQAIASPLIALIMPLLLLAAFRFDFGVVAGISLLMAVLAVISFSKSSHENDHAFAFAITYLATLGLSNLAAGAGSAALRSAVGKLSTSEELLRGMFDKAAVGLLLYDIQKDTRTFNAKFCDMLGYPTEKITEGDLRSISFAEEQQLTQDRALQMQRGEIDSFNQEKRYIRQSGEIIWVSLTMSMLRDKNGSPHYLIGVFEDITSRKRAEKQLEDSEKRFRITFEQAAVGVALLDRDSQWLQVNQNFCEIVGYTHDELLALRYDRLIAPEDIDHTVQAFLELQRGGASQIQLDHRYMRKSGDVIWVNSQFSVARNDDGDIDYQIVVIKDITERKRAEAEVERLALYDYLTGLPNRRLFGDRLRTAVMAAKRSARFGAVIYIDLDNFKQLNDTHGHNAGDDFLKMVAHRLQRNLREEDTVARLGGDEFVILLQNVSDSLEETATATAAIAAKIQSALSESFLLPSGIEHIVTSSLGITLFPKDVENAEDLLKEADIAMYRVKASRRNAMRFYEPAMKAEVDSRLALERALRRALHNDEFELYLQPQYDADRKIVSCEALLRWPQPDNSFISPSEFIPIAEDTGLIVPLGEWVLRRAAKLARALELAGHSISIGVNVSPRQFGEANFVERVRTILSETGTHARRIVLEITEGVVVADFEDVRSKMLTLRRMGIRLSIDDFGTGHSSLAYLKLLPLHELKIDRAFIHSLPGDVNDVAIVEAVLSVARHLQFEVVAEGVESVEQFEFLKQHGCHRFQGYLLARPALPAQHFPELSTEQVPPQKRREH